METVAEEALSIAPALGSCGVHTRIEGYVVWWGHRITELKACVLTEMQGQRSEVNMEKDVKEKSLPLMFY